MSLGTTGHWGSPANKDYSLYALDSRVTELY
jgi:hypothetical protein